MYFSGGGGFWKLVKKALLLKPTNGLIPERNSKWSMVKFPGK